MENENLNQVTATEPSSEPETLTFTDKMIGVFSEPGRIFSYIAANPLKTNDWLLPVILSIVITIIASVVVLNNPSVKESMRDNNIKYMQKAVEEGRMTQDQADQAIDQMDKMQGMQYIGIFVGTPIVIFISLFFMALIYWILAKVGLRGNPVYTAVLVVVGLTQLISIVEGLVGAILSITLGKFPVSVSVGALITSMEPGTVLSLLNKINPFTFWELTVIGIGLAKVSNKETSKGITYVFGLWVVFTLFAVFVLSKIPFLGFLGS